MRDLGGFVAVLDFEGRGRGILQHSWACLQGLVHETALMQQHRCSRVGVLSGSGEGLGPSGLRAVHVRQQMLREKDSTGSFSCKFCDLYTG